MFFCVCITAFQLCLFWYCWLNCLICVVICHFYSKFISPVSLLFLYYESLCPFCVLSPVLTIRSEPAVKKIVSGYQHIDRDVKECALFSSQKRTRAANPSKEILSVCGKEVDWNYRSILCFSTFAVFWPPDQKINHVCRRQEADRPNRHQAIEHNLTLRVKMMCSVKTRSAETINFKCTWNTQTHTKRTHQLYTGSLTDSEQRDRNCAIEVESFVCFYSFLN